MTIDTAKKIILNCDNPTASAIEWSNNVDAEVDDQGDVWLGSCQCWADEERMIEFARWLRDQ